MIHAREYDTCAKSYSIFIIYYIKQQYNIYKIEEEDINIIIIIYIRQWQIILKKLPEKIKKLI
jgi:hypothetical protein